MGNKENNGNGGGIGADILDFLGYDTFDDWGIIGIILWIICLPFILIKRVLGFLFDLIF